jgi:flavin reductase (DIM6/NTAB) family NADH-FMN oxidoreductase RutF
LEVQVSNAHILNIELSKVHVIDIQVHVMVFKEMIAVHVSEDPIMNVNETIKTP